MAKHPSAFAIVGRFESPAAIFHACEALRDGGYTQFDAHTPFPVHGLEKAMGLKPSRLPWIVLGAALFGAANGFVMQTWVHLYLYPQNISGKPLFAFPAMVPVLFELTVLFAAFGAFFGMWGLNRLPQYYHPVMRYSKFGTFSDDQFLLSVEAIDPRFDPTRTRELLEELGAKDIEEVAP